MNEDREKPLIEHILELRSCIIRIFLLFTILLIITFLFFSKKILYITIEYLPDIKVAAYSVIESFYALIYISIVVSIILTMPYALYELYLFAKPGLYENEKKFIKRLLISSGFLSVFGLIISFKLIVPLIVMLLSLYTSEKVELLLSIINYIKFLVSVTFLVCIILQTPIILTLLIKYKILDINSLKKYRIFAYVIFFIIFGIISPEPSFIVTIVLTTLTITIYELSLLILKRIL